MFFFLMYFLYNVMAFESMLSKLALFSSVTDSKLSIQP